MSQHPARINDAEAHALWKRAIELQAAAERDRSGSQALPAATADSFSLGQVVEAAKGAGIDPVAVHLAFAERRLPEAERIRRDRWTARWARALLPGGDALEVSRAIEAAPEKVAEAFDAVVSRPDFLLTPEDRVGPDPPFDGVLVYRVGQPSWWGTPFHGGMFVADARVVLVTVRSEGDHSWLRLRLPYLEHGVNLSLTGVSAGMLGGAGGYGAAVAGGAVAGWIGTAAVSLVAAPAAMGVLAGGALGVAGFRRVVRWGRRKGEMELRRLLQVVALEAERGNGPAASDHEDT